MSKIINMNGKSKMVKLGIRFRTKSVLPRGLVTRHYLLTIKNTKLVKFQLKP